MSSTSDYASAADMVIEEGTPEHYEYSVRYPPELLDDRARKMYEAFRAANPWLPEPDRVCAGGDLELSFGVGMIPTLKFTVYVDLPIGDES